MPVLLPVLPELEPGVVLELLPEPEPMPLDPGVVGLVVLPVELEPLLLDIARLYETADEK